MPRRLLLSCALALFGLALSGPSHAGKKVLLKVQSYVNTNLEVVGTTVRDLAEQVNLAGAGRLKIKLYEPGRLVPPAEILQAVSAGQISAGFTVAGFSAGLLGTKANIFTAVPFGPDAPEYLGWVYYGDGRKLWQEMYDQAGIKVHSIPCGILPPETSGWFKQPIDKPEDLDGLRIRFFGLGGMVLERLGASTTLLPGSEVFPALEKGAIDATEFSLPVVDERLGFYKILKYNYFPGWHQPSTLLELVVNKGTWTKMDGSQRALLEMGCKATMLDNYARGEALEAPVMEKNVSERGVHNRYWSKEMLDLFRGAWAEVLAEQKAADPDFARIWDNLAAYRGQYRLWSTWGFLPRPGTERVE